MKKTTKTVALLAVLSVAAVGCQKETIMVEPQTDVETSGTVYTVDSVQVTLLQRASPVWESYVYPQGDVGITTEYSNEVYYRGMSMNCLTN